MGLSIYHTGQHHLSLATGIIASRLTGRMRYIGTSGSFKGHSGASCWADDGTLLGMQVEVEKVPHTMNGGRPASSACGGRCGIVPVHVLGLRIRVRSNCVRFFIKNNYLDFRTCCRRSPTMTTTLHLHITMRNNWALYMGAPKWPSLRANNTELKLPPPARLHRGAPVHQEPS